MRMIIVGVITLLVVPPLSGQTSSANDQQTMEARVAKLFAFASSYQTIEERIAEATSANRGITPPVVELCGRFNTKRLNPPCKIGSSATPAPQIRSTTSSNRGTFNNASWLSWLASNSDLVVQGTILDVTSAPLQDRTFVFSIYTLRLDRIFSSMSGLSEGQNTTIATLGGNIEVSGVTIKASEGDMEPLLPQQSYVLFLRKLPGVNTYRAMGARTFILKGSSIIVASKAGEEAHPIRESSADFLKTVQAASVYVHPRRPMKGGH